MPAPSFGLDHLVVLVGNLDEAADRYTSLGFTLAPLMHHPFGTANRLAMFGNNFLEIVGVANHAELKGPGVLIAERLAKSGSGAFGIALNAEDIHRDRVALAERGIESGTLGEGSRAVPFPDGRQGLARFSTSLIPGPSDLPALFFLAQQHVPEVVWIPEWQRHPNTAKALSSITLAVETPGNFASFFERLFGSNNVRTEATSLTVQTPLGQIHVIAQQGTAGHISAASIEVADLSQVKRLAAAANVPVVETSEGHVLVDAPYACGLTLEFIGI